MINFKISMGGQILLFIKRFDSLSWHPHNVFDNVIKIQSFGNDFFDIDGHKINHPILTNKYFQY